MSKTDTSQSLDDDENQFIYIKHVESPKTWEIKLKNVHTSSFLNDGIIANESDNTYGYSAEDPVIIKNIKLYTLPLIFEYMNYFGCNPESVSPEAPIIDIHISDILGKEYPLYANLYLDDDSIKEKIVKLNDHVESALYFGFKYLHKKLCAIIANLIKDSSIDELNALID
jgi:hypothetical protein